MSISIGRSLGTENTSPLYINTENSNVLQIKSNNSNVLMKFPAYTVGNRKINGVDTYVIEHDNTVLAQYSSNIMKNYQYTEFVSNVDIQGDLSINSIVNMTCNVSINQLTTDYVSIENLNNFSISSNSELLYDFGSNEVLYVKGNIGVGTSNPEAQLHVTNSIIADSNITSPTLYSQFLCNVASSITLNDNSIVIDSDSVIINNIVYSGDLNFDTINIENNNTNNAFTSNLVITNDKNEQHGIKINQINDGTFLNTAQANAINIDSKFPDTSTVPIFLIDTFGRIMSGKNSTKTVPEADFAYTYYINNSRKPYIEGFINLHSQDTSDKLVVNCNCFMGIGTDNVVHPLHIENPYTGSEPNLSIFPSIVGLYNTTSNEVSFFKCFNSNNDVLFNFTSNGSLVFGEESLYPAENYKLEINESGYIKNLFTDQIVFNSNIDLNLNSNSIVNVSNIDVTYITARDGLIDNLNVGSLVTESFSTDAFNYSDTDSTEFRIDAERFLYTGSNLVLNSSSTFFDTNPGLPDDNIRIYANGTATASVNAVNIIGETKNLGYKLNNTNTVVNSTAKLDLEVNDNRFTFGVINNSTTPGDSAEAFITTNTNLAAENRELTITSDGCRIGSALHLKQSGGTGTFGSITAGDKVLNVKGDLEVVTDSSDTSFYVNTSGNVGIGTDNPTEKLDVRGDIFNTGNFLNNASQSATTPAYSFYFDDDTGMYRVTTDTLGFSTGGTERVRIDSSGRVGIGTDNPVQPLDVNGNARVDGSLDVIGTNSLNLIGTDNVYMNFYPDGSDGGRQGYIGYASSGTDNFTISNQNSSGDIRFNTNNQVQMLINPDGNVGIGTDDPTQKLHVHDGGIVFSSLYNSTISTTTPVSDVIKNSSSLTGGNWYRIAVNGSVPLTQSGTGASDGNRCSARFTIISTNTGQNSTYAFYAGGTYGSSPFINLLSNTGYAYSGIQKVRLIEDGTNDGLAIEIYVGVSFGVGTAKVSIDDNYQTDGFTLVDFALAPASYDNYNENEISVAGGIRWGYFNFGNNLICMKTSRIGVGTDSPLYNFHVNGSIRGDDIFLNSGDASDPTFTFYGDNDTGMFRVTTDTLGFTTGGTERVRIDSSGYVGIGTNNPIKTLDVRGDIFNNGKFLNNASQSASSPTYSFYFDTDTGMYRATTDTLGFSTGGTERVRINGDGKVGIGTNNPLRTLHVYDTSNTTASSSYLFVATFERYVDDMQDSSNPTGGGLILLKTTDTNNSVSSGIGWAANNDDNSENDSSLSFWTMYNGTIYQRMLIDPYGKVGIGTTNPSYDLDVWSNEDSVWNARIYNYTGSGSDDDCKLVVQAGASDGEAHYTLMTPDILWHMVTGAGASGESLEFKYDDNPGSSPDYNSGTLAGYITKKSDNASLNFTGQHRTFIKDIPFSEASSLEGLIVSANTDEYIKMSGGIEYGNNAITINESLPLVNLSSIQNDKACFGVISLSEDPDTREDKYGTYVAVIKKEEGDTRIYINSVGEGAMWVINSNGNIESGDYITTSSVKGYGMKQHDDILHNYTVAKITMNCDFNPPMVNKKQIIKHLGTRKYYYKELIIKKAEYDTLPEKYRRTEEITITQEEYDNMNEVKQRQYTNLSKIVYKALKFSKTLKEGYKTIEIEEMINTLDEHGQIQWEDTEELEPKYNIRYVDASGEIITEEQYNSNISNNIPSYKAAFVGCTYHCG
jgi:hypothetical protein